MSFVDADILGAGGHAAVATSESFVVAAFEVEQGRYQVVRIEPGSHTASAYMQIQGAGPVELAADDDRIFVSGDDSVAAWDENGQRLAAATSGRKLIDDEEFLYWLEDVKRPSPQLVRAPKATLAREELGDMPSGGQLELATDDASSDIYWTDESGSIARSSKVEGTADVMATTGEYDDDDFNPLVAVDRTSVYWIDGTPGTRVSDDGELWLYRMCKTSS